MPETAIILQVVCLVAMLIILRLMLRTHADVSRMLDENRRCNDDFAVALKLAEAGRYEEAKIIATAWRTHPAGAT